MLRIQDGNGAQRIPWRWVQRLVRNVGFAMRESGEQQQAERLMEVFAPLLSSFENAEERSGDQPNVG